MRMMLLAAVLISTGAQAQDGLTWDEIQRLPAISIQPCCDVPEGWAPGISYSPIVRQICRTEMAKQGRRSPEWRCLVRLPPPPPTS
jgi:hypothetical protein